MARSLFSLTGLLLLWSSPSLAGTAVFTCDRADTGAALPCRIRLAPYDYTKPTLISTGGEPIQIPLGRYEIRAVAAGFALARNISYTSSEEISNVAPRRVRLSLVPGGVLYVDPAAVPSPGALQLLSLATGKIDVLFVDRERDIPIPAGKLVAVGLRSPGQFLGVTPITEIRAGHRTVIDRFDQPSAGHSNVLIRGDYIGSSAEKDVALSLVSGGTRYEAAASTNATEGSHYSVFYGVPSGSKALEVKSTVWRADSVELDLPTGGFLFEEDLHLVMKPSLTAKTSVDGEDKLYRWNIGLYSCKESEFGPGTSAWPSLTECARERAVEGSGLEAEVSHLDAKWYFAIVELNGNRLGKQVDLRSGQDRVEYFEFKRHSIVGMVRRGERGVASDLAFENYDTGDQVGDVTSGPDGSYEAVLWQEGTYRVTVRPRDSDQSDGAVFRLRVESDKPTRQDFVIPTARVTLAVVNEITAEPIRGATVFFNMAGASEERETGELGELRLPPLPPGPLRLFAKAEGYERKDATFQVLETGDEQRWKIRLKPVNDDNAFHAVLSNGTPAGSAIVLWNIDSNGSYRSRQECDTAGLCRLAERPPDAERLFLVHRDAGLTILPAGVALHDREVRLHPRGGPLIVQIRRGEESAAALVSAKILVDGTLVPSYALETVGNFLEEPFRLYLYSGVKQPIVIPGLPAGVPLTLRILATGVRSNVPALPAVVVQLPTQRPLEIELP